MTAMSSSSSSSLPASERVACELLRAFKETVSPLEWTMWLADLRFERAEGNTLSFATPSPSKADRINERYKPSLQRLLSGSHPKLVVAIVFDASKGIGKVDEALEVTTPKESKTFHPRQRLADFIPLESNRIAVDFCQKVMQHLGSVSPLYLYGKVGLGKTHLLQAIGHHFESNFPFLSLQYLDPNDFVSEFTRSLALGTDRDFRLKYKSLDLLLFDDIQFFAGKEKSAIEFFHIFNAIAQPHKKQMVFCSDRDPSELNHIDERLKSRLSSSAIIEINEPSTTDLVTLIRAYSNREQLPLSNEVLEFLVEHSPKDIRKVLGALNTLIAFRELYNERLTVDFCKKHLRQLRSTGPIGSVAPETLLLSIANHANLSLAALRSPNRSKTVAHYRQLAMYLLREHTPMSILEIGNTLGGKASSTISAGHKKISQDLRAQPQLRHQIDQILNNL